MYGQTLVLCTPGQIQHSVHQSHSHKRSSPSLQLHNSIQGATLEPELLMHHLSGQAPNPGPRPPSLTHPRQFFSLPLCRFCLCNFLTAPLQAPGTAVALAQRFSAMMVAVLSGAASALAQKQLMSETGSYPQVGLARRLTALFAQASSELVLPAKASSCCGSSLILPR